MTVLRAGERIGNLRLHSLLGRGGMGEVWHGTQISLGRQVAVKRIADHLVDQAHAIERFTREAECGARIRSPHVVQVFDFGSMLADDGSQHWLIVSELVEGGASLQTLVDTGAAVPWPEALEILRQATTGIAAAHDLGIVHRDIKPANLLIGADARVRVADFGLARAPDHSTLTIAGCTQGSPRYLAPEGWSGAELCDKRSDVYSLGVTAYQLLCGVTPFTADTLPGLMAAHLVEQPAPIPLRLGIPAALSALVMRCLAKAPDDRPADASAMLASMAAIADHPADLRAIPAHILAQAKPSVSGTTGQTTGVHQPLTTAAALAPTIPSPTATVASPPALPRADATKVPPGEKTTPFTPTQRRHSWRWPVVAAIIVALAGLALVLLVKGKPPNAMTPAAMVLTATDLAATQRIDASLVAARSALAVGDTATAQRHLEAVLPDAAAVGRVDEISRLIEALRAEPRAGMVTP